MCHMHLLVTEMWYQKYEFLWNGMRILNRNLNQIFYYDLIYLFSLFSQKGWINSGEPMETKHNLLLKICLAVHNF